MDQHRCSAHRLRRGYFTRMHADDTPSQLNPALPSPRADAPEDQPYDFGDARFNLEDPEDLSVIRFLLSQALYGEATGVYCGRSLYTAGTLEAARFYVRQARQELNHLELFAEIFRSLELRPEPGHWVIRLLSSHNDYYPLKVFMEHAMGEGMVLDIFRDVLLQTLPDTDPRVAGIKKKLRVVCKEEEEHVAWGERETVRILKERPELQPAFWGLFELQMWIVPFVVRAFQHKTGAHPVLRHLPQFLSHVQSRARAQATRLGVVPAETRGSLSRLGAIFAGVGLLLVSRLAPARSRLEHVYLEELGFQR